MRCLATLLAAIRRGWVWPIRRPPLSLPRPMASAILGNCVVLPEPVSPQTMMTWYCAEQPRSGAAGRDGQAFGNEMERADAGRRLSQTRNSLSPHSLPARECAMRPVTPPACGVANPTHLGVPWFRSIGAPRRSHPRLPSGGFARWRHPRPGELIAAGQAQQLRAGPGHHGTPWASRSCWRTASGPR